MPRYVQQRDEFRCGPVAILNALKWSGRSVTAKLIPRLCKEVSCSQSGTQPLNFTLGLIRRGKKSFTVRRDNHPSLANIENRLRNGGAVILVYWYHKEKKTRKSREFEGHLTLITGVSKSGKTFRVVNYFTPKGLHRVRINREVLWGNLRPRCYKHVWHYAAAWYLRKR
jgi:hypothetical protein